MIEKLQLRKLRDSQNSCDKLFELGELYTSCDGRNNIFITENINSLIVSQVLKVFDECEIDYEIVSSTSITLSTGESIVCRTRAARRPEALVDFLLANKKCKFYLYFGKYIFSDIFTTLLTQNGDTIMSLRLRFDMQDKI